MITVHITGSALLVSQVTCKILNSEVGDDGHGRSFGRKQNVVFKGCRNCEVSSKPDYRHGGNGIAGWERGIEAWEFKVASTSGTHRGRFGALFRAAGTACPGSCLRGQHHPGRGRALLMQQCSCDIDEGDGVPP